MLAYVFWHWPTPEVDLAAYEASLSGFHQSLATVKPHGFLESAAFRVQGAPWVGARTGYEDWYLLEGSSALDVLNEAAVAGLSKEVHDRVARVAAGGTAGLYRLHRGDGSLARARCAAWLGKPQGTSYEEFYAQLQPWTEGPEASLWRRQMTLGPTPEFCLRAPKPLELPARLGAAVFALHPVWP